MKKSLFNAIVKDKTVKEIAVLRTEDGRNFLDSPWIRWAGMEKGGDPEDWDDASTSLEVVLTLPEYILLKSLRRILPDMVAAREAQKKKIDCVCFRRREPEEPQCLPPI